MITFNNVTKVYSAQSRPALDGVSFEIADGEFAFLIGPSGSGKSTFLELMVRYSNVTSGDIYFGDFHVNELKGKDINALRQSIGYVFQDFRLLPKLNVYQNVAFALEVIGKSKHRISTAVPQVLEMVGLENRHHAMPHELSGGGSSSALLSPAPWSIARSCCLPMNPRATSIPPPPTGSWTCCCASTSVAPP